MTELKRRDFLKASAAVAAASAAGGFGCVEIASAAPIQPPTVDQLAIRVLVDGSYNLFLRPAQIKNIKIEPAPRQTDYRRALHNQWGLSLLLEFQERRRRTHHHGRLRLYARRALNNMAIVGADLKKIEAPYRQPWALRSFGGLLGLLDKYRSALPADLTLYAGGEDNFCQRWQGAPGQLSEFGSSIVASLHRARSRTVLGGDSGGCWPCFHHWQDQRARASRRSPAEHPVEFSIKDGLGCNAQPLHYRLSC